MKDPEVPFLDRGIEDYITRFSPPADPLRAEMEEQASGRGFPIVGPLVGSALELLATAIRARRVFEMGSGFGYSAWWFARAVGRDGLVVLTEGSRANCDQARDYLDRAGVSGRVRVECGDALEIARQALEGRLEGVQPAEEGFDVVFCDIDKEDYPKALPLARRLLRRGGLFVVDNMLWFGKVLARPPAEPSTRGVVELGRLLGEAEDFRTVILPLRDGVSVSLKS